MTVTARSERPKVAGRSLDPDELAALEEQRDFLLASLRDLDEERAAGDIDPADYEALKDDYTARAASVLRAIEAGRARFAAARRPFDRRRTGLVLAAVAVAAVLAGVVVAAASGSRQPGDSATGDVRLSTREQLLEADQLAAQGDAVAALELYDEVLAEIPDDPDALTGKGSLLLLAGRQAGDVAVTESGVDLLRQALAADPDHHRARFEYGTYLLLSGDTDGGAEQFEALLEADPPLELRTPAEAILDDIDAGGDGLPDDPTSGP